MYDWTGDTQFELTVIERTSQLQGGSPIYRCKCTCGKECYKAARDLSTGAQTCGKCGYTEEAEYSVLLGMIQRCTNPNATGWKDYGGRGIMLCERWIVKPRRVAYKNFLEDMGRRPSPLHSIDRIDVNGNYEPANCRWETADIQATNTRPLGPRTLTNQDYLDIFVSKLPRTELAAKYGIALSTVQNILGGYYNDGKVYNTIALQLGLEIPSPFSKLKTAKLRYQLNAQEIK